MGLNTGVSGGGGTKEEEEEKEENSRKSVTWSAVPNAPMLVYFVIR